MNIVERAAEVIEQSVGFADGRACAKALADRGLLISDADRAVLDLADKWERARYIDFPVIAKKLKAAILARREAMRSQK